MCDQQPVLNLTEDMARNYDALMNMLNGVLPGRSSKRAGCGNGAKKQERKRRLLELQNFKCAECQVEFVESDGKFPGATRDHIIPYRFGSTLAYNSEFVCQQCNSKRNTQFDLAIVLRYFGSIDLVDACGKIIQKF
jgi:hypothetical protein